MERASLGTNTGFWCDNRTLWPDSCMILEIRWQSGTFGGLPFDWSAAWKPGGGGGPSGHLSIYGRLRGTNSAGWQVPRTLTPLWNTLDLAARAPHRLPHEIQKQSQISQSRSSNVCETHHVYISRDASVTTLHALAFSQNIMTKYFELESLVFKPDPAHVCVNEDRPPKRKNLGGTCDVNIGNFGWCWF